MTNSLVKTPPFLPGLDAVQFLFFPPFVYGSSEATENGADILLTAAVI